MKKLMAWAKRHPIYATLAFITLLPFIIIFLQFLIEIAAVFKEGNGKQ